MAYSNFKVADLYQMLATESGYQLSVTLCLVRRINNSFVRFLWDRLACIEYVHNKWFLTNALQFE